VSERTADEAQRDSKRSDDIIEETVAEIGDESLGEAATAEGEGDAPAGDEGARRLQAAESLAEERHHQFLRLSADFDNFRRRVEREREELRASVARELLTSLLPAYDNLERALQAVTGDVDAGLVKGLEMTRKSFLDGLAGQGVERVLTTGQPFDPAIHEAIQSTPDASAEGTVLDEYQAGFRWRDRVLRAALVKVSSGPAAADN
jgi:molecular chaperone GrpE